MIPVRLSPLRAQEVGTIGRGGRMYWVARDIYDVIDAPAAYEN